MPVVNFLAGFLWKSWRKNVWLLQFFTLWTWWCQAPCVQWILLFLKEGYSLSAAYKASLDLSEWNVLQDAVAWVLLRAGQGREYEGLQREICDVDRGVLPLCWAWIVPPNHSWNGLILIFLKSLIDFLYIRNMCTARNDYCYNLVPKLWFGIK